jgi:tetratricopeptide (TPR) repeat protein
LKRAVEIAPRDFLSLMGLYHCYQSRGLLEPLAPLLDEFVTLRTINPQQADQQDVAQRLRPEIRERLGPPPKTTWRNVGELDQMIDEQLARGRVESAVQLIQSTYPPGQEPWETVERLANLYLHLGKPDSARAWLSDADVFEPNRAVRDARIAVCELVAGRFAEARALYQKALMAEPNLFEARYGLAVLEQDDGRAGAAYEQALSAVDCAPSDAARASARAIASAVGPYAGEPNAKRGADAPRSSSSTN